VSGVGGVSGMRGAVDGLVSPFPIGELLPSVYGEDEMALRFTTALDDLFAPLLSVLDCLPAYFDPALAPADFVSWLGGWVGAELAGDEPDEVLRRTVGGVATAHRLRGTVGGVAEAIRLAFGVVPEVIESGGATWSPRPRGDFPGDPVPGLVVRLRVPDPGAIDRDRVERLVAAVRPAHIPCVVEIIPMEGRQ
jgi:phage tail-like protein